MSRKGWKPMEKILPQISRLTIRHNITYDFPLVAKSTHRLALNLVAAMMGKHAALFLFALTFVAGHVFTPAMGDTTTTQIRRSTSTTTGGLADYTKRLVSSLYSKYPGYSIIVTHVPYKIEGNYGMVKQTYKYVYGGNTYYYKAFYVKQGYYAKFTRYGNGGLDNWAVQCNPKYCSQDDNVVTFS